MRHPFREFGRLEREMEEMAERLAGGWPWGRWWGEPRAFAPAVDMIDRKEEIVVRADLPGLEQKDVEVTVEEGTLTIRGERKRDRELKDEDYYLGERWGGTFSRSLALPAGAEADKVRASFRNGVLEVHLPKTKEAKGKKIEIKVE